MVGGVGGRSVAQAMQLNAAAAAAAVCHQTPVRAVSEAKSAAHTVADAASVYLFAVLGKRDTLSMS